MPVQVVPHVGDDMARLLEKLRAAWSKGDMDADDVAALMLAVDCIVRRRAGVAKPAPGGLGNAALR